MLNLIEKIWALLVLNGILAILLVIGLALLFAFLPAATANILVILLAAYFILEGVITLALGIRARFAALMIAGILGLIIGIMLLLWPGPTILGIVYAVGIWAVIAGILRIAAAISLRKLIENEWLLGLSGVLTIVFGILLFLFPIAGVLAFMVVLGAYILVFGIILLALGLRLRGLVRRARLSE